MPGFFADKLTEYSDYYLDGSRVAVLLRERSHRYTRAQILTRSAILMTTAVSAFLGGYLNNKEKSNCSDLTISIALGTLGFTVSHFLALFPLIYKRYQASKACHDLANQIRIASKMANISEQKMEALIQKIFQVSMKNEKHSNASQTWGHRKSLLSKLNQSLETPDENLLSMLEKDNFPGIIQGLENDDFITRISLKG